MLSVPVPLSLGGEHTNPNPSFLGEYLAVLLQVGTSSIKDKAMQFFQNKEKKKRKKRKAELNFKNFKFSKVAVVTPAGQYDTYSKVKRIEYRQILP